MGQDAHQILRGLFGDYRVEWAQSEFANKFVVPPYFTQLESNKPCFLFGGRGTGKTVALKSLRFDAAALRAASNIQYETGHPTYLGIYLRINKNRVRAFDGSHIVPLDWNRLFAHYFNLLAIQEFCSLSAWISMQPNGKGISAVALKKVARTIDVTVASLAGLLEAVDESLDLLELYVNNPSQKLRPVLSIAESPIIAFVNAIVEQDSVKDRRVFLCIDEYENLLDYQQAVLNTYIKHAEQPFSYKVGVRQHGLRCRNTIDSSDLLMAPDDYASIELTGGDFVGFCKEVVQYRIDLARQTCPDIPERIDFLLPTLTREEEVKQLGGGAIADKVCDEIRGADNRKLFEWATSRSVADLYFLNYWSLVSGDSVVQLAGEWLAAPNVWSERVNNHGYASLFWLLKGKGKRARKDYSGEDTFLALAAGNIRYYLELIDESIEISLGTTNEIVSTDLRIDPKHQTSGAQKVAKRRLDQLEGASERGVELKRLVLAIGKVFFEFARSPIGRTPEINSFVITGTPSAQTEIAELLTEGVSHLAFIAGPRTKPTSDSEMRDDEYRLHPIYCPFFEFSHRRKRRVTFSANSLLLIRESPSRAIRELMGEKGGDSLPDDMPAQLAMFNAFYEG